MGALTLRKRCPGPFIFDPFDRRSSMNEATEIHDGHVRLFENGSVEHWDGSICSWRPGWGVWATVTALGEFSNIEALVG